MKPLIPLILALALSLSSYAQSGWPRANNHTGGAPQTPEGWRMPQDKPRGDQRAPFSPELYMKALVEFVSKEACLTENEATKFEPLLREMHQKQHTLMEKQRKAFFRSRKNQSLTEEDFERLVNNSISTDIEVKKIEQTYYKKFHNVMPWKKVFAVRIALNKWQMEALNRFQPDRGNRRNQQPNR